MIQDKNLKLINSYIAIFPLASRDFNSSCFLCSCWYMLASSCGSLGELIFPVFDSEPPLLHYESMDININLDTVYNLTLNTGMVGRRMVVWDHRAQAISYEWGVYIIQICQCAIDTRFQLIFLSILRVKTYAFRMSDKCYATELHPQSAETT